MNGRAGLDFMMKTTGSMKMKRPTFAVFLLLSVGGWAFAQEGGDPATGHVIARDFCAECHAIEAGEAGSPNVDAPAFQMIANDPEMSDMALTVFFQMPHETMPNLIVHGTEAADLVAYIRSLE